MQDFNNEELKGEEAEVTQQEEATPPVTEETVSENFVPENTATQPVNVQRRFDPMTGEPISAPPQEQPLPQTDAAINEPAAPEAQNPPVPQQQNTYPPQPTEQATPVEYPPVKPIKEHKRASKGVRVFALILAAVILLSAACATGYFFGKGSVSSGSAKHSEIELAARPKDTDEMTAAQVYDALEESIVGIYVYNQNGKSSYATGVVYSKDGYIVTNDHIYSEVSAPKFKVYTSDGTAHQAEYVAGDMVSDLAILKMEAKDLKPATFGDSKDIFCGENVVAIGKPSDPTDAATITQGIVSLTSIRVQTTSSYSARLIQTDSAINPGSSGGALSNMYGQVVGITSSKLAGAMYDAIGYAIPSVTVKRVAEELIKNGKVTNRAKLGISYQFISPILSEVRGSDVCGLSIAEVSEESDLYGKVEVGDIITHINGTEITKDEIVLDIIEEATVGDKLTFTISKTSGKVVEYEAKLIANIGESSYNPLLESAEDETEDNTEKKEEKQEDGGKNGEGGGTFNFPFGP